MEEYAERSIQITVYQYINRYNFKLKLNIAIYKVIISLEKINRY